MFIVQTSKYPTTKVRFNFVKELKEVFGDKLDWYGTGVNSTKLKKMVYEINTI